MGRLISFCSSTGRNTGGIDCDVQLDAFIFMLIGSAKFTPAEYATEATLKAAIVNRINRANGDSEKLYPWAVANDVAKTTESDTVETAGDGTKRTLRVAPPSYDLTSWNVGINQEAAMIAFNNVIIPAFCFDKTGKMVGKYDSDKNFIGAKVKLYTAGAGFSSFQNGPATKTSVGFIDAFALNQNARLFEFASFDTDEFEGLLDVSLKTLIAAVGNVHTIGAYVDNVSIGKQTDLYGLYEDDLADTTLWIGKSAAGADVVPTSVAKDATNKGWTLTFPSAVVSVRLATPPVLYAAGVKGVEGIELAVA